MPLQSLLLPPLLLLLLLLGLLFHQPLAARRVEAPGYAVSACGRSRAAGGTEAVPDVDCKWLWNVLYGYGTYCIRVCASTGEARRAGGRTTGSEGI